MPIKIKCNYLRPYVQQTWGRADAAFTFVAHRDVMGNAHLWDSLVEAGKEFRGCFQFVPTKSFHPFIPIHVRICSKSEEARKRVSLLLQMRT